ncbi:MAG: hypothetical protein ABUL54_09185 [Dongia sp.]
MRALLLVLCWTLLAASTAQAQETIDQFNAANAENRRHTAAESQLRNDATQLRRDQARGLLNCQGAGAPAACAGTLQPGLQQRQLMLRNRAFDENNAHRSNLQGIGVTPAL